MPSPLHLLPLLLLLAAPGVGAEPLVAHRLDVSIDPDQGTLEASARLELPPDQRRWTLWLHAGLRPKVTGGEARLKRLGASEHLERFRLDVDAPGPITLSYAGRIRHALEDIREGMGRARQVSRGTIEPEGVVLDGYSGWYPRIDGALQRFDLSVRLPPGWFAVSQGAGPEIAADDGGVRIGWREEQPQDDIYLIAAPFHRYTKASDHGEAQVYLRRADPELAQRYLDATERYLALYSALIGPYPYAKFALVENFWETGYGMPSFTLLGPRVIRLPFIIETSYPHEILHNWWGNGVYVDYASGNWSEGLTAYLADHLLAEERGAGADYRRDSLKAYADYVQDSDDFPVRAFRGRHGSASQAIGYGKTLMILHMLRRDLGDAGFIAGLQRFWQDNRFRTASFDDLRQAFEATSGRDLSDWFAAWTERTGAPALALADVVASTAGEGYRLSGRVQQIQSQAPYPLTVPLVVHLADGSAVEHRLPLDTREGRFELALPAAALRVDLDPNFDLFRRLEPGESPVTLSALFGAEDGLIVLPSGAPPALAEGYRRLAEGWAGTARGWKVVADTDLDALPPGRPIWLLGWENRLLAAAMPEAGLMPEAQRLTLGSGDYRGADWSFALTQRVGGRALGLVAAGRPEALPGLARKLPHYGKYGYLVFSGEAPDNRVKGQWPAGDSPLRVWLSDARPVLAAPERPTLRSALAGTPAVGNEH